ncbi:MAG: hypothetical protein NZT92_04640 [Abditibacteriales bacterium]|nr:hypothetical protein [Abditibacteriales bacterium]
MSSVKSESGSRGLMMCAIAQESLTHRAAGKRYGERREAIAAAVVSSGGDGFAALAMRGIFKGGSDD